MSNAAAGAPGPVHHVDFGGADRPVVVLVHGLGGSHLNWERLAPLLTSDAHVLALDLRVRVERTCGAPVDGSGQR